MSKKGKAQKGKTQKGKAPKGYAPQPPRRWTPMQAQGIIGRLLVVSILLGMLAASIQQVWPLVPALALWAVMALMLYKYWRCPVCGKTLPKTGKTFECPRCGAKIE